MRSPILDQLQRILEESAVADGGQVYAPAPVMADGVDPRVAAVCLTTPDGRQYTAGAADHEFAIQSISKTFTYALALHDRGAEEVLQHIDVEPSGDAFSELSLDPETRRPRNPMINAGAIVAHSLVKGKGPRDRNRRILRMMSRAAGRELKVDRALLDHELSVAWRNRSLGYMLRAQGVLDGDYPMQYVEGYLEQCSVTVTTRDLSMMAATLANHGRQPVDHRQVIDESAVRQVLSVMLTCGMYDSAGDWVSTVGIPAKSGVGGGIIGALPGQIGIAAYSPRLDAHGNSLRGVEIFERLSDQAGLHIMAGRSELSVLRELETRTLDNGREVTVVDVQGYLHFAATEYLVRSLVEPETPLPTTDLVVDLHDVAGTDAVARRLLLEVFVELVREQGLRVHVIDPEGVLEEPGKARRQHRVRGSIRAGDVRIPRIRHVDEIPARPVIHRARASAPTDAEQSAS